MTTQDRVPQSFKRDADRAIRTWIVAAAASVSWLLPISWHFSAALFTAALFALGVFYPAIQVNRPDKSRNQ
jgi:hypothetical protein